MLKRTISWMAALTACALIGVAVRRLPGSGGLAGELRWSFARDQAAPADFNRAARLLHLADDQEPGTAERVLAALLRDADTRVVEAALIVLVDLLDQDLDSRDQLRRLFLRWYAASDIDTKLIHLDALLNALSKIGPQSAVFRLDDADLRWIVAGTLRRNLALRETADRIASQRIPGFDIIRSRLRELDGLTSGSPEPQPWLRAAVDRSLAPLLDDPVGEVRWGAGRILALSHDPRGRAAVNDWLKNDPHAPRSAAATLRRWFGPDWQAPLESGPSSRP